MVKIERHKKLCAELHDLYLRKNVDYGDAYHKIFADEGFAAVRIRLKDKLYRIDNLTRGNPSKVPESLRDTLIDLAGYALLAVLELDGENSNE